MSNQEAAKVIPLTFLRSPQRGTLELVLTHPDQGALLSASKALLDDVRRRYPGEELRCQFMKTLDEAVMKAESIGGGEVRRIGRQKALEMMEHLVRYLRDCE